MAVPAAQVLREVEQRDVTTLVTAAAPTDTANLGPGCIASGSNAVMRVYLDWQLKPEDSALARRAAAEKKHVRSRTLR